MHVISMDEIRKNLVAAKGTEDEPFEGEISLDEINDKIQSFILEKCSNSTERVKFVFDGIPVDAEWFYFNVVKTGAPQFIITLSNNWKTFVTRYNISQEAEPENELGEEVEAELKAQAERSKLC